MSFPNISTKLPITVIILAHRDDERLASAVASAQFAAEVLVIDTSNELSFEHLRKKFAVTIITYHTPQDSYFDFAAVRNVGLEAAIYEWVFFLDSDEVITPDSIPVMTKIMTQGTVSGVFVRRQDVFFNKLIEWGEAGNFWVLRFGRKQLLKFIRPVHEIAEVSGTTMYAPINIRHYPHTSIAEFWTKISSYARAEAYFRLQTGDRTQTWEMFVFPVGKFLLNYGIKLGFLDGWRGFIYALMMSLHSFFVRVYYYELNKKSSPTASLPA